ncbi:MAG: dihydrolipoamide acetyltransferase family protein [Planctomycetia bacterium]|nr:dihydrolipoamide acetyltransferase family protein [Planctomycetia bacterium]
MSIEFKLPELGENIVSGDIVNVLVAEGDVIEPNQGVFELETDKAVVEIPCSEGGKIVKLHVGKGDRVKVGQTLITLEPEEQGASGSLPAAVESATPRADKPPTAPPSSGSLPAAERPSTKPAAAVPAESGNPLPAGPAARRLARELDVDLHRVHGSGARGRITPEDVRAASGTAGSVAAPPREPAVPPGEPDQDAWGPIRRDRLSQIRRTIAAQMVHSAGTIPHVTNFDDADVTELEQLRKGVPQDYLGPGVKLTMMPLVMKAVALSLRQHPIVNASLDEPNDEIVYKQYVNLGVAVDTPRGLVVPAVRDVDRMSIGQIAEALGKLAETARSGRFAIEELRGGTFTVSNLGAVGGTYSTPIINHPEVAILLVGRSRWMPVVRDGDIEKCYMMPLSLSFDHRIVDGAAAGRFLNEVIGYLQNPGKLLLA